MHVIEATVVAICNDCLTCRFELSQIIYDLRTEEGGAVFQRRLIDDDLSTFGLDTFHDALDGALAKVVGVALHRETIDTDGDGFLAAVILVVGAIGIPAGLAKDFVGNEVLTGAIALDNGGHHILGHIGIVGQELFGVLGQAVTAIAKAWVIVVGTDARIETDARDNGLGVEALDLGIGVEFVEIRDS